MKFGVREICDVVFKAKNAGKLGTFSYVAGQPVLYIDSAKTSTMEGAATTVYAQGGKGNARLIAWEGERTLTFTVEDALLSPMGFAILSGAGLMKASNEHKVYVHTTTMQVVGTDGSIDLSDALGNNEDISKNSPVFAMVMENGSISEMITELTVEGKKLIGVAEAHYGKTVFVDYYVEKDEGVYELTIDVENFAGYYYVEASTLFRRESDGKDLPAELIFPNVKIQSNFTFSMAATGDPSTFTFTMDAMPGYTRFDRSKKVLCAIQIVDEDTATTGTKADSIGTEADGELLYPVTKEVVEGN
jgi:hypothetical protein